MKVHLFVRMCLLHAWDITKLISVILEHIIDITCFSFILKYNLIIIMTEIVLQLDILLKYS